MGLNFSSQRKHNIHDKGQYSQYKQERTHRINANNAYNFQPNANKNILTANNPFTYSDLHRPANNSFEYNDLSRLSANKPFDANLNISSTNSVLPETSNDCKRSSNSGKETQDMFHVLRDKLHNFELDNNTVRLEVVEEAFIKECDNKNQIIYPENNTLANITAVPPSIILSKDDFIMKWFSWKKEFLAYMNLIDQTENNKQRWGIMLLNRMGPIGQEIYRTFIFNDDKEKEDIYVLLEKFDYYCIFEDKNREYEEIDKYVNNLKVIASKHMTDTDEIVKKKILQEIDTNKFSNQAKNLIPGFSFPLNIQLLTLKEITYIWMLYENVGFKKSEIYNSLVKNCNNCGMTHEINKCPAYGKQCNKCNNRNHFWIRCPSQFFSGCSYCGEDHFIRQCPAYMNKCGRCHRLNHFSWKCPIPLLNCNFCGLSHIASKSVCSAINTVCTNCNRRGHIAIKCKLK